MESTIYAQRVTRAGRMLVAAACGAALIVALAAMPAVAEATERERSSAAGTSSVRAPAGGHEQQLEVLRGSLRELEKEGVERGRDDSREARAAPGLGTWFLQGVFRGLGQGGAKGALAEIQKALGGDRTEEMLAEMSSSLNGLIGQVEAIATRMEQLFADTQFRNTHSEARVAHDAADGWSRVVEGFERSGTEPSALQLNNVAAGSYAAVYSLKGLITDGTTGAIPLMLTARGQAAAVSTGAEQWEEIEVYRDHFLAVQALAITNLAWVAEQDPSYHATYLVPAVDIARETLTRAHEITGAPHPQDPGGGAYLHRVHEDWALMTEGRPTLEGEQPAESEIRGSELEPRLQTLAKGYQPIDGVNLEQYMADAGFNTSARYVDSYGWSVTCNGACSAFDVRAWADRGVISGNSYERPHDVYINKKVSGNKSDIEGQLRDITAKNQQFVRDNPKFWLAPIETNAQGWAALTDEESIRVNRDGLEDLAVERQTGDRVAASFANGGGYDEIRISDVRTGDVLDRVPMPASGQALSQTIGSDMVLVELGYRVDGGGFDARGGSVLTANPGESSMQLTLERTA